MGRSCRTGGRSLQSTAALGAGLALIEGGRSTLRTCSHGFSSLGAFWKDGDMVSLQGGSGFAQDGVNHKAPPHMLVLSAAVDEDGLVGRSGLFNRIGQDRH
jgi:hypothetical protein